MNTVSIRRAARLTMLAAALAVAACAEGGRTEYANDGDTGAAAPATVPTPDAPQAPDSTAGVSDRTGRDGVAGDTLGATAPPRAP